MANGPHIERLKALEQIERDIATALENAGQTVAEYGKDKPNQRAAEGHAQNFLKTVNSIEVNLMKQIQHLSQVSTTHPHTGSSYGAQKDWQMSVQRLNHVAERLDELDKLRTDSQNLGQHQSELRKALSHQSSFPPMSGSNSNT